MSVTIKEIERCAKLTRAVENFRDMYAGCILWGSVPDGDVKADVLIAWMVENPEMAVIAETIRELSARHRS